MLNKAIVRPISCQLNFGVLLDAEAAVNAAGVGYLDTGQASPRADFSNAFNVRRQDCSHRYSLFESIKRISNKKHQQTYNGLLLEEWEHACKLHQKLA